MVDGKQVSRVASAYANALEVCAVKSTDLDGQDVDAAVTQILSKSNFGDACELGGYHCLARSSDRET